MKLRMATEKPKNMHNRNGTLVNDTRPLSP